jgi:hypothetical protein
MVSRRLPANRIFQRKLVSPADVSHVAGLRHLHFGGLPTSAGGPMVVRAGQPEMPTADLTLARAEM